MPTNAAAMAAANATDILPSQDEAPEAAPLPERFVSLDNFHLTAITLEPRGCNEIVNTFKEAYAIAERHDTVVTIKHGGYTVTITPDSF